MITCGRAGSKKVKQLSSMGSRSGTSRLPAKRSARPESPLKRDLQYAAVGVVDDVCWGIAVRDLSKLAAAREIASRTRAPVLMDASNASKLASELLSAEPPGHMDTLRHLEKLEAFMSASAHHPDSLLHRVAQKRGRYLIAL
eukprot:4947475-Amphidinium_carterae.1